MKEEFITPFRYPQIKHTRKYRSVSRPYGQFRALLRREFRRKCVYCRMPDYLEQQLGFEIDHYQPHTRGGDKNEYVNLFYSCRTCNGFKSNFWPTKINWADGVFIPNPCDHIMTDHLKFVHKNVQPQSQAGIYTEKLLHLNDIQSIHYRETMDLMIDVFSSRLSEGRANLKRINKSIHLDPKNHKLVLEKENLELSLKKIQTKLERITF